MLNRYGTVPAVPDPCVQYLSLCGGQAGAGTLAATLRLLHLTVNHTLELQDIFQVPQGPEIMAADLVHVRPDPANQNDTKNGSGSYLHKPRINSNI